MPALSQIAALPVRRAAGGTIEILLVTSRETRRWVIPKGWPWPGLEDHAAAAEEAREEAGVLGTAMAAPLGVFTYGKRQPQATVEVLVSVYRLDVAELLDTWPEAHQRERAWFTPEDAAAAVDEPELRALILKLQETGQE